MPELLLAVLNASGVSTGQWVIGTPAKAETFPALSQAIFSLKALEKINIAVRRTPRGLRQKIRWKYLKRICKP